MRVRVQIRVQIRAGLIMWVFLIDMGLLVVQLLGMSVVAVARLNLTPILIRCLMTMTITGP